MPTWLSATATIRAESRAALSHVDGRDGDRHAATTGRWRTRRFVRAAGKAGMVAFKERPGERPPVDVRSLRQ